MTVTILPTIRGFAYKIYIEGDPDPTKSDNVVLGSLTATRGKEDPFTGTAINLQSNTTYAIRAYATNKPEPDTARSLH